MNNFRPINLITNKMERILERHKLQKLIHEEIENLSSFKSTETTQFTI